MLRVVVLFYLVFEVSTNNNEPNIKVSKNKPKLSPQAYKGTAQLINLINKQLSDEELDPEYKYEDHSKVDLEYYYNIGFDDRKKQKSVLDLMHLVQKNYDAQLKFAGVKKDDVRVHVISNPDVLKRFKSKLKNQTSSRIGREAKIKRRSKRRKAAYDFDSLSRENRLNYNRDDSKYVKERDKKFEDSLKDHFNGKLSKIVSEDSLNEKRYKDDFEIKNSIKNWDTGNILKRGKLVNRDKSSEAHKKDDIDDWHRQRDNRSGSKEKWTTKGWESSRERQKPKKEWVDYVTPKTKKTDDYKWSSKDKKTSEDWGQSKKSKMNRWTDNDTTKRDKNNSWEKKGKKNKEDDWSQVGIPQKSKEEKKTTKKHKFDDNVKADKWSIEVADSSKKKNSDTHSGGNSKKNASNKSWEKEKKKKNDDSWDNWTEKKTNQKWALKTEIREKKFHERYKPIEDYRPKKVKDFGRSSFGRTPIPFIGKKGIYED